MSNENGKAPTRVRVEFVVLLALVIQSVLLGFWGGQINRAVNEHDREIGRLESFHLGASVRP